MSLNVALNIGVSGLLAQQEAIAATSENIANVNTPNFSRREVSFVADAIPGQFAGVSTDITRAGADRFLQSAAFGARADAAGASVLETALGAVDASLGAPGDNISFANGLDDAAAALIALSANPSSLAARADALSQLDAAFRNFGRTQDAISTEAVNGRARLESAVDRANTLLEDVFRLNQALPSAPGAADQLDARLEELSSLLRISVVRDEAGRATVSTPDGTTLASAGTLTALQVRAGSPAVIDLASADPQTGPLGVISEDITASLQSGEIGAGVALLNTELPAIASLVNGAAQSAAAALNSAYAGNASVGATGPAATPLLVETDGVFTVNAALLDDPSTFAIARPSAGFVGGQNDGAGAGLLADALGGVVAAEARDAIGLIGAASRAAADQATSAGALDQEVSARLASSGGVNLDEELSNLILFQRAFGANARVISAVDELWQTLLTI